MPVTATDLIGQRVSFDHDGKRLAGIVTKAESAPAFGPGKIPDFTVWVRGASGRELKVSLVESYMTFPDR
jgi:hypothetical protein